MFFNRNKQETKKETIADLDSLQSIESMRDVLAYLMETNKDHFLPGLLAAYYNLEDEAVILTAALTGFAIEEKDPVGIFKVELSNAIASANIYKRMEQYAKGEKTIEEIEQEFRNGGN